MAQQLNSIESLIGKPLVVAPPSAPVTPHQAEPVLGGQNFKPVDMRKEFQAEKPAPKSPITELYDDIDAFIQDEEKEAERITKQYEKDTQEAILRGEKPLIMTKEQQEQWAEQIDGIVPVKETQVQSQVGSRDEFDEEDDDSPISFADMANVGSKEDDEFDEEAKYEKDTQKQLIVLKTKVKEKLKPFANKIDLDVYTVSSKPAAVHNLFSKAITHRIAEVPLMHTKVPMSIQSMNSQELEILVNPNITTDLTSTIKIFKTIYDSITSVNKPEFESWLDMIDYRDLDDMWWGIFAANYAGVNALPIECVNPKCDDIQMTDIAVEDMVEYRDDEAKALSKSIMSGSTEFHYNAIESAMMQISDEIVVEFRMPTVYSNLIEPLALDKDYREKYYRQLSILTYIKNMYVINDETRRLDKVTLEEYENDFSRTVRYKFNKFIKLLSTLTPDQLSFLQGAVGTFITDRSDEEGLAPIKTYIIPASICPECGKEIPKQVHTGQSILFLRQQLGMLVSM